MLSRSNKRKKERREEKGRALKKWKVNGRMKGTDVYDGRGKVRKKSERRKRRTEG